MECSCQLVRVDACMVICRNNLSAWPVMPLNHLISCNPLDLHVSVCHLTAITTWPVMSCIHLISLDLCWLCHLSSIQGCDKLPVMIDYIPHSNRLAMLYHPFYTGAHDKH